MQINAIFNANIYVNGNSLLGQASEIKLPDVEVSQDEYKGLGLAGTIKLPSGVEALEGEITWNSFYENVFATVYHPFKAVQLMVRADIQKHDAQGLASEVPLVTILTGTFSKNPLGSYKPKEKAEFSSTFQAHEVRQLVDGKEVFYFNAFKNEYRVNGSDVLANFRRVVGA